MEATSTGSVRVDLVGGTLDLEPINLIIPNVVTLNVATSLKAKVTLEKINSDKIIIESKDYNKTYEFNSEELSYENIYRSTEKNEMSFILQILDLYGVRSGLKLQLSSGAPAGSGLGGSSAMGVTLYSALDKLFNNTTTVDEIVRKVKGVEGRILNQGIPGYQDYYPALVGGVLALSGIPGEIVKEQLYSEELVSFLENHLTLVYSGISRNSGINNWDVYKGFFDKDQIICNGLTEIADKSFKTYQAIKDKDFEKILTLIGEEGEVRKSLSAHIVPESVALFASSLQQNKTIYGLKMCGAGGGGCFIVTHPKSSKKTIQAHIQEAGFQELEFKIEAPL